MYPACVSCSVLQESKFARFNIDAGRVLFLSLEFERALELLRKVPRFDFRELVALYPELQVRRCALLAAVCVGRCFPRPASLTSGGGGGGGHHSVLCVCSVCVHVCPCE
jgi:hypothetical protein